MKRPKSKVFKHHKDLIKTAVANTEPRVKAKRQMAADVTNAERIADEKFLQENRLELEINVRNPI
jgi:hypothetical protein